MVETFKTYRVSQIGGGIPSLEAAKSIAVDVFGYGLWGHGYTVSRDGLETERAHVDVLLEQDQDHPVAIFAWIPGWRSPAGLISEEERCVHCRHAIRIE